jgi:hypothetical protein
MTETVECYSGADFGERPRAFDWNGERHQVQTVLARWETPAGPCYRVRTEGNLTIELSYVRADERWRIRPEPEPA